MKKIFTLLEFLAISSIAFAQNLLTNPGFENNFEGWSPGTVKNYTTPNVVSTDPHGGSKSVQYTGVSATTGFYQNVANIEGGSNYTISFWYKATGDNTDVRLWSVYKNAAGNPVYTTDDATTDEFKTNNKYLEPSATWKQFTATMPAGIDATNLDVAVRVYKNATLGAFDDFVLAKGTLATMDFSVSKYSLVQNTVVTDKIIFAKDATVTIYNTAGQIVKTVKVSRGTHLDVASLSAGTYIVTGSVNGQNVSQKIIKK